MVIAAYLARTNFFGWEMYEPLATLQTIWLLRKGGLAHCVPAVEQFLDCHSPVRMDETYQFLGLHDPPISVPTTATCGAV
jgi:hypothetical protein